MDMKNEIAKRNEAFTLTHSTVRKRLLTHGVFGVLIGVLSAVMICHFVFPATLQVIPEWFRPIKVSLLSIGIVVTLVYYIIDGTITCSKDTPTRNSGQNALSSISIVRVA